MRYVTLFQIGAYDVIDRVAETDDDPQDLPLIVTDEFDWPDPVIEAQITPDDATHMAAVLLAWIAGNPSDATVAVMREFCGFVVRWRRGDVDPLQAAEVLRAIGMVRQIHRDGEGGTHG